MFQLNLWRQYFDQSAFSFGFRVQVKIGVEVAAGESFFGILSLLLDSRRLWEMKESKMLFKANRIYYVFCAYSRLDLSNP